MHVLYLSFLCLESIPSSGFVRLSDILQVFLPNYAWLFWQWPLQKTLWTCWLGWNHWTTLRSVCLAWALSLKDIWLSHHLGSGHAGNKLFREFQASIMLQLLLGDPGCPQAIWDMNTQSLWLCLFPFGRVQNKPLKEGPLYSNPKNSKTLPSLWPTITWMACFQCLQYHFLPQIPPQQIHLISHLIFKSLAEMLEVLLWWQEPEIECTTSNSCPFRVWELPTSPDWWILLSLVSQGRACLITTTSWPSYWQR